MVRFLMRIRVPVTEEKASYTFLGVVGAVITAKKKKKSSFSDFQMEVGKGMKTDWGISLMESYLPGTHLAKEGSGRLASSGLTDNASVGCLSGSGAEESCRGVACRLSQ